MVSAVNLSKRFPRSKTAAVDNVSLAIRQGELFGLIGPDGAGKTTLFRMLTTLLLPDGGSAAIDGRDVVTEYKAIRRHVGYMPGKFSLYQDLTVEENLNFFATLFGTTVQENYDLIKDIYIQIEPFSRRRAGKLSGGMKQKLALCCALIHQPAVLFLDEPTTGVDPVSRKEFWEMLKRLKERAITIVVSTPYMDEATRCDRIAFMQAGKILAVDVPASIISKYPDRLFAVRSADIARLLLDLRKFGNTKSCFSFGEYLHVSLRTFHDGALHEMRQYVSSLHHRDIEIRPVTPGVEDCFIRLLE